MEGVVRVVSKAVQEGLGSVEMGKREITFEVYEKSIIWLLDGGSLKNIFGSAQPLTWNLMSRGLNTCMCSKHLMWRADVCGISFSHVKNDPVGSRNLHPRHIYKTADKYPVCCVTVVMEYLVVLFKTLPGWDGMLLPGPKQEERHILGLFYNMC